VALAGDEVLEAVVQAVVAVVAVLMSVRIATVQPARSKFSFLFMHPSSR
jgi:uncharacterized membrane protein